MRLTINVPFVRAFMNENNLDEKLLAEKIGVTRTQVYRVLRGQREPGNEFIAGLTKLHMHLRPDDDPMKLFIFIDSLPKGKNEHGKNGDA